MAARPEVREIKDLKGRKIGVRSLTGPATAMTQFLLEENGLDSKRDVQVLRVGGTAERLAALKEGLVDAALIDEAVAHRAKEAGLNIIQLKGLPHIHTGAYARRGDLLRYFKGRGRHRPAHSERGDPAEPEARGPERRAGQKHRSRQGVRSPDRRPDHGDGEVSRRDHAAYDPTIGIGAVAGDF